MHDDAANLKACAFVVSYVVVGSVGASHTGDLIKKAEEKAEAILEAIKAREEEEKRKKEAERQRPAGFLTLGGWDVQYDSI